MNPYNNFMPQQQTNILYANGIEDVRYKPQMSNSIMVYFDNDKDILYRKTINAQGQVTIDSFDLVPHKEPVKEYVSKTEFDELKSLILGLQSKIGGVPNGNNRTVTSQVPVVDSTKQQA